MTLGEHAPKSPCHSIDMTNSSMNATGIRRPATIAILAVIGTCLVYFHSSPLSSFPPHSEKSSSAAAREEYIQRLLPVSSSRDSTQRHLSFRRLLSPSTSKTSKTTLYVGAHIPDQLLTVLRQHLHPTNNTNQPATARTQRSLIAHQQRHLDTVNVKVFAVTVQNTIDTLAYANRCDVAVAGVGLAQCNLRSAWAYCAAALTAQVAVASTAGFTGVSCQINTLPNRVLSMQVLTN